MHLLAHLASIDEEFSDKQKTLKLIRYLSESFAPIVLFATLLHSFEKLSKLLEPKLLDASILTMHSLIYQSDGLSLQFLRLISRIRKNN